MTPAPVPSISRLDSVLAPIMFGLGFTYLSLLAGLIHRSTQPEVTRFELELMGWGLFGLWPVFVVDCVISYWRRAPEVSRGRALARVFVVLVAPPLRMTWVNPVTNHLWLPRLGWRRPSKDLLKTLDRAFGAPMLLFAFLIMPVLAVEYFHLEEKIDVSWFATALHVSTAVIWLAFAVEFVVKVSAAPSSLRYVKERWLDLAIVVLPTLEVILTHWVDAAPLARLLRLGRALGPDQIGKLGKAYRFRGLMMKGWHAFLLLEGVTRLTGNAPAKRLRKIERQIADLEDDLADLHKQAEELRVKVNSPNLATEVTENAEVKMNSPNLATEVTENTERKYM